MKIKFWGTRGSIPTAEPEMMKYGGNTSCIEVRLDSGELLIFDAGTGIRRLGLSLLSDSTFSKKGHILISHCHWDHIQGFPFFLPAFSPSYDWTIYGQFKMDGRLEDLLRRQMEHLYFPVKLDQMGAKMKFVEVLEEEFRIGNAKITSRHLNHPQGNMGFRVEDPSGVFVYCSDTEHIVGKTDSRVLELAQDADVFVYDGQYTEDEFKNRIGWGHSTWVEGVKLAQMANVKKLVLFHHDPSHDDDFIDRYIVEKAQNAFTNSIAASRDLQILINKNQPANGNVLPFIDKNLASYIVCKDSELHIKIPKDLQIFTGNEFAKFFEMALKTQNISKCIVDFADIREINSHALGTLAKYYDSANKLKIPMKLKNVSDFIKEVLEITRFIKVIEII